MTNLITRITELAGPQVAAQIRTEFGGRGTWIPGLPDGQPTLLQLHCRFDPILPIQRVADSLPAVLAALRAGGVVVQAIRIEQRGIGDAYLDAIGSAPGLDGISVAPSAQ